MTLDNDTTLASYLTHIQANVRRLARLDFERQHHQDFKPGDEMHPERKGMMELWETLRLQLMELLGLQLKPFSELAAPGPYHAERVDTVQGPRCLHWNFGKLKKMADKHRRKTPTLRS
jgi:hypothetical protein